MVEFDASMFMFMNQGDLGGALNSQFGVPGPIFGMTSEEFRDMPSSILRDLLDIMEDARNKADALQKEVYKKAMIDAGIFELDTEEGTFEFLSDTSRYGLDRDSENLIGDLQAFIDAVNSA